jgi:hypothetical protein
VVEPPVRKIKRERQIRILKRSVMTMIFDFEPWQLDIDIDLTKQLYRSCKGDFVWVEKK